MDPASLIHQITSSTTHHPDGTQTSTTDAAVWTLAHKGYSGNGRLGIWVYPTEQAALLQADGCHLVFFDTSRNTSRRFCDLSCQNRAKASAYRARRQS
ncbi:MAG TPA: hypothetical protein DGG94_23135 [Micromonosporaceae bacterium]|nr:hypothetical protein [Micromonosporaceae bacterium]HCU52646.1 hypothetical protein [Micromonosporaceae bacterium]